MGLGRSGWIGSRLLTFATDGNGLRTTIKLGGVG